ncbi:hypothetical protein [Komagataeibacter phage phiKX1]|nr:hypothetical protein [Komagataeibacter phage phiKX1]BCZ76176.1 hypothetical protein [Komagataeibacter phage phiKX2]
MRSREEQIEDLTNAFGEEGTFSFIDDRDAATKHIDEAIQRGRELERAEMGQKWRPIETAPKDGTCILVPVKFIGADVVTWWAAAWRETTNGLRLNEAPTHWMPLPNPPENGNG